MIFSDRKILVVAAHPDDEVLGAGGLMATYPGVMVAIASEGTSNENPESGMSYDMRLARKRRATRQACQVLQSVLIAENDFIDQKMDASPELSRWIEDLLVRTRPDVVVTHCPTDLNRDHRAVAESTTIATRRFSTPGQSVSWLLGFSVDVERAPSAMPHISALSLPLDEAALKMKMTALECYASEMRQWPHPRSFEGIEHHARWIGSMIGVAAAEPYTLIRGVL